MAKKTVKSKSISIKKVVRTPIDSGLRTPNGNFIKEPPKAALKQYAAIAKLKAQITALEEEVGGLIEELPAAFEREKGFSFLSADGVFVTCMPKTGTKSGITRWFVRGEPTFEGGHHPRKGEAPAKPAKKAKAEKKPAKAEKKAAKPAAKAAKKSLKKKKAAPEAEAA